MSGNVIVIGAGAAGLMAAVAAAEQGNRVTVLEKNEKAGKKIYITGKGRCNLTNDCDTSDFFSHVARNHRFLYSAVYGFDHEMVKAFFEENGCPVKVERGGRVFPVSDHASDVTAALLRRLKKLGVLIKYNSPVSKILTEAVCASASGESEKNSRSEKNGRLEKKGRSEKNGRLEKSGGTQREDRSNQAAGSGGLCGSERADTGRKMRIGPERRVRGVRLRNGREIAADAVILCTGGLSYPSTGSDGDGLGFVKELGIQVTETAPSLVPFETREVWCRDLQGLALKNVAVKIFPADCTEENDTAGAAETAAANGTAGAAEGAAAIRTAGVRVLTTKNETAGLSSRSNAGGDCPVLTDASNEQEGEKNRRQSNRNKNDQKRHSQGKKKKPVFEAFGELLFTHFGLSGPIILTASCYCDFLKYPQGFRLYIDLKPALTQEQIQERLVREFDAAPQRHLPGAVRPLFPARLAEAVTDLSGLETHRRAASFSAQETAQLAALIKNIPVTVTGTRGYNEAIITRGGISVKEIDPSTMEFRKIRGLYAAGEILDVDAETGGYNLQIAWSTGRLAGSSLEL